jgi:hypothetical protein
MPGYRDAEIKTCSLYDGNGQITGALENWQLNIEY